MKTIFMKTTFKLKNFLFMFSFSWKTGKPYFLFTTLKIILDTASPFIDLWIVKLIMDELSSSLRLKYVLIYIGMMFAAKICLSLCYKLWQYFNVIFTTNTLYNQETHFQRMYAEMDYANLEDGEVDEKISFVREGFNVESFVTNSLGGLVTSVFKLIGYVYIVSGLHPLISVILLFIIASSAVITKYRNKWGKEYSEETIHIKRLSDYFFTVMTDKEHAQDVRLHGAKNWLKRRYRESADEYLSMYKKQQGRNFFLDTLGEIIGVIQTVVMYGYSAYEVALRHITIGSFTVYIGAVTGFVSTVSSLVNAIQRIVLITDYVEAYHETMPLSVPGYTGKDINQYPDAGFSEIVFDHVSFKYRGSDNKALDNVCLTIKRGERLSIVGNNGAGKSTFIKLLCRLYEPTEGRILMDGIDIKTINYKDYIDRLSVIFQDYVLFPMTIRDNVGLNFHASDNAILDALELSQLGEKFKTLPDALNSELTREFDPNGVELSGGESQKLVSARAYCKNTPLIILDEPTAALDPISEDKLYHRFDKIIGEKTAVYITHRLASVKFCDKIAVFEQGKIVEYGTHDSLMDQRGLYFDMFEKQAEYYREDSKEAANG